MFNFTILTLYLSFYSISFKTHLLKKSKKVKIENVWSKVRTSWDKSLTVKSAWEEIVAELLIKLPVSWNIKVLSLVSINCIQQQQLNTWSSDKPLNLYSASSAPKLTGYKSLNDKSCQHPRWAEERQTSHPRGPKKIHWHLLWCLWHSWTWLA